MAKVLIGIPTKNRQEYVKEAIQSVLEQTFTDIRVVVSDNCSRPEVSAEVERYVSQVNDPRLSYYLQPEDGGEYGQGRYFMRVCADEEFIVMLHDDDRLEPDQLEYALSKLDADKELAFFSNSQYLFDQDGNVLEEKTREYSNYVNRDRFSEGRMDRVLDTLLKYGLYSVSSTVFRIASVHDYGLVDPDCEGLYPFEFNVFLRIGERGLPAYYTPKKLTGYRWHDASMRNTDGSTLNKVMVETLIKILEKRSFDSDSEKLRRRLLSFNYRNYALIQIVAEDRKGCFQALRRALSLNPLSLNIWAYSGLAILFPFLVRRYWGPRVNLAPPR